MRKAAGEDPEEAVLCASARTAGPIAMLVPGTFTVAGTWLLPQPPPGPQSSH